MMPSSTFVAEDPQQIAFLLLKRLTSPILVRRFLEERAREPLPGDIMERKARGVASAVQSAVDYWMMPSPSLNLHIVSRYYALLQLTIAEQVAAPDSQDDLATVQRHTKDGHGLGTFQNDSGDFPDNFFVHIKPHGHFTNYYKFLGLDLDDYATSGNPKNVAQRATRQEKAESLSDLLRRVPELQSVVLQHLQHPPLSFQIVHAEENWRRKAARAKEQIKERGTLTFLPEDEVGPKTTFVTLATGMAGVDLTFLKELDLGRIVNLIEYEDNGHTHIRGEILHEEESWHKAIKTYKSSYSPTSYTVAAFKVIQDPFVLHIAILYALSIVARYFPDLWYELMVGKYTHIRSLIEFYLSILDRILPLLSVERITGQRIHIAQPGSLTALI
jgi:hypothetical protein